MQEEREMIKRSLIALFRKVVQFNFVTHRGILHGIVQFDAHTKLFSIWIGDFNRLMNRAGIVWWNSHTIRWQKIDLTILKMFVTRSNDLDIRMIVYFGHCRFEDEIIDR
jgi:hypothetical protein